MLAGVSQTPQFAQLEPPASHYLLAATGWLELGNPTEAHAELENMAAEWHTHPLVLDLRWQIFAQEKKWDDCLKVAATMTRQTPQNILGWIHQSYALHELKRTAEARDNLLPVAAKFPEDFLLRYNLACYECQLGRLAPARQWLKKAMAIAGDKEIQVMALNDLDLQPMWPEIRNL